MIARAIRGSGRTAVRVLLAMAWLLVLAGPAAADPARPGDVRSEVTALTPATDAVRADVVGGDSFLRLRVDAGTEVLVLGYEQEPYLRVGADGTVEVNDRSPARWLNESRLGGPLPDSADPTAAPAWRAIGDGGTAAWHDHRIHWMGNGPPRPPQQEWRVPLVVDGRAVTIEGRYAYQAPPAAWPWWALAALVGLLCVVLPGATAGLLGVAVAGSGAVLVGARLLAVPSGSGQGAAAMALGALAIVLAAVGWSWRHRSGPRGTASWGACHAAAGAALLAYAVPRLDVLSHRVLVTDLPAAVDRLSVSLALGVGAAAVIVGVRAVVAPPGARAEQQAPGQLGGYQPPGTRASASGGPQDPRS